MKIFKILSHPYTLISCFLFILISGQHLGGFYVMYLLLALPHGGIHSLLAVAGIGILLLNFHQLRSRQNKMFSQSLDVLGLLLLVGSLLYFFLNDTQHYNWGTFDQGLPMFTICFTSFIGLCFLVGTFWNHSDQSEIPPLSKV